MSGDHRNDSVTKFKWATVAAIVALILILGTIQELVHPG